MTEQEKELRIQLAACYRIFDYLNWDEMIYNHITVRVPGDEKHFLINPYGLHYSEVTASNLVKVDIDGNIVEPSDYPVNPAGMLIHSTIHSVRHDAQCIGHTHTDAGMTVACQDGGLRIDNFYSVLLYGRVAYHDFHGLTVDPTEKEELVKSLGDKNLLILRSHGLLACGETIPQMFGNLYSLQRACEIQAAVDMTGKPVVPVAQEIADRSAELLKIQMSGANFGDLEFAAMTRLVDKVDDSYRDI